MCEECIEKIIVSRYTQKFKASGGGGVKIFFHPYKEY
jgi:hypothetical protein